MKKWMFLLATLAMLGACPKGGNSSSSGSKPKLQIAVEESYVAYFQKIAKDFTQDRDVDIEIVGAKMFDIIDAIPVAKGNSADIFMVVNDRIGDLVEQRLIDPLPQVNTNGYTSNAINAGTYKGDLYFVPMSTDTTLLIYNKAKVNRAPATLSELNPKDWAAKFTDFYHTAGMLYANGGYVFGNSENDLGVANAGSIAAGNAIQKLYNSGASHWTLMRDDTIAHDVMMNAFYDGEISYVINGPWMISDIAKAGIDAEMVPIPSWDGSYPYKAFVGTKGMSVNAYSRNKDMAKEFLKFLAKQEYAQLWYEMTGEVAPHNGVIYPEGSLQATSFTATANGQPMFNIPAFKTLWEPMADALKQIANGENVNGALEAAEARIKRDIADLAN